jgi:tetratricopeptide (TPR) repeat protein
LAPAVVHAGDPARARRLLEEGQGELPDEPQYAAAHIACHLAGVAVANWSGDGSVAVDHARAARVVAVESGALTPLMDSRIGMDLAEALRNAGRFVEADTAFAEVHARLEALGRGDTERAGTVLNNWGLVLNALGKPRQAERMFRRSVEISAEGAAAARVDPVLWNNLAQAVFDQGRIDEAIALSTRAHEEAVRAGNAIVADQAMLVRARYHVARGQLELGERLLNDVEARFKTMFPPTHAAFMAVGMDRARLAQERGDWAGARTLVDQVAAIDEAAGRGPQPPVLRRRAVLRAHFGEFAPARHDAERALAIAVERVGEGNRASTVGIAYLTLGDVLTAEGRNAQARAAFESAVEHLDATVDPAQPDLLRARTLAGH